MRHEATHALIRVLVCDDSRVHTELLADVLKRDGDFQVTTSTSGSEGLTTRPTFGDVDVLLLSSSLDEQPSRGFEILRILRASNPELRAVVLVDSSKGDLILEAFRAGARGVFGTQESGEILTKCIRRVFEGQIWANTEHIKTLVQALASSHSIRAVDAQGVNLLTKREMEVVRRAAQGMSNREIAERLHLSQHTIKNCLFRIFDKLGVSNRVELLLMTLRHDVHVKSTLQHFLDGNGFMSLRDEATLIASQKAADQGVLLAQVALAEFYSSRLSSPSDALHAYMWSSIASEQMGRACKSAIEKLTMDQILQAEEMIAERRGNKKALSQQTTSSGPSTRAANEKVLRRQRAKSDSESIATPA